MPHHPVGQDPQTGAEVPQADVSLGRQQDVVRFDVSVGRHISCLAKLPITMQPNPRTRIESWSETKSKLVMKLQSKTEPLRTQFEELSPQPARHSCLVCELLAVC